MYPVRVDQAMVCSGSHIQRTKSHAACFSSSGAARMSTNIVPPVGTLARTSRGKGAATTGKRALSSR